MLICRLLYRFVRGFFLGLVLGLCTPYIMGYLAYGCSFGEVVEQLWLNKVVDHLAILKANCPETDPELREVLTYAMQRYNQIGPFNVAVSRCDWYPFQGGHVLGINNPLCPGITLDINVLLMPVPDGAMILVHESLHDYYPYAGHGHIDPIVTRLEALNMRVRRL